MDEGGDEVLTVKGTSAYNDTAAVLLTMKIIGACIQKGAIPSAVPELRTLGGKIDFDPKSMATASYDVYKKIEQAGRFSTNIPFEEFISVLAKVRANCFMTEHSIGPVSYTHLRAHETPEHLVCRLLLEKKKKNNNKA
eukprot:TRINITY_DN19118_c0_g1_i1.p2 TRINITY_DN19118_c0_g1~~TRINITY_DN19118_c0_g1_i1.p2  ORF type:complete len:138 (+),score=44.28 TRINITY_DN19118_c0_g1_i1:303-716(+)